MAPAARVAVVLAAVAAPWCHASPVDASWALLPNRSTSARFLQTACTPPSGVTCQCQDPAYPCYASYFGGCSCLSGWDQATCESNGGSYCQRPASCVPNCQSCATDSQCSECSPGYLLVGGQCTAAPADADGEWLKAHNLYRCMHGAPAVTWSAAAAASAQSWANSLSSLVHSSSYDEAPPAGPAGENLALGYPSPSAGTTGWYNEVSDCKEWPGCPSATATGMVGHFTCMVWAGVTEIGCATKEGGNIQVCHYRSGDTLSSATCNMAGGAAENVVAATKTLDACIAEADGVSTASNGDAVSIASNGDAVSTVTSTTSSTTATSTSQD